MNAQMEQCVAGKCVESDYGSTRLVVSRVVKTKCIVDDLVAVMEESCDGDADGTDCVAVKTEEVDLGCDPEHALEWYIADRNVGSVGPIDDVAVKEEPYDSDVSDLETESHDYKSDVDPLGLSDLELAQQSNATVRSDKRHKCPVCDKLFGKRSNFTKHMLRHVGEKPYACNECGETFTSFFTLSHHKVTHTGIKPYTCEVCETKFYHRYELKLHKFTHTGGKPHKCKLCDKKFSQVRRLKHHILSKHPNGNTCSVCKKKVVDKYKLKRHMMMHTEQKPFMCEICGKTFIQNCGLDRHMKTHKSHWCYICEQAVPRDQDLAQHMLKHKRLHEMNAQTEQCVAVKCEDSDWSTISSVAKTDCIVGNSVAVKEESCDGDADGTDCVSVKTEEIDLGCDPEHALDSSDIADRNVGSVSPIDNVAVKEEPYDSDVSDLETCGTESHDYKSDAAPAQQQTNATVRSDKRPKCPVCDKLYSSQTNLTKHMIIHTGEKPYGCDECGKTFNSMSASSRHKLMHTGIKPYTCDVCEMKFRHGFALRRHKLVHTGDKPFPCKLCDKKFWQGSKLKHHILLNHLDGNDEKIQTCSFCEGKFPDKHRLRRHMMTHNDTKPFKCEICGKAFVQNGSLKRHMKTHIGEKSH